MKKTYLILAFVACVLAAGCEKTPGDSGEEKLSAGQKAVEKLMADIGTLPAAVEVYEETVESAVVNGNVQYVDPKTDLSYNATETNVKRHYSITNNVSEFTVLDPRANIWPGSLIQGGSLGDGVPASVPIGPARRRKVNITLEVVTGGEGGEYAMESEMSASAVTRTMDSLLSRHLSAPVPAQTLYTYGSVQSIDEIAHKTGLDAKLWKTKLSGVFGTAFDKTKSYVAVRLDQRYYTVEVDPFDGIGGTFTPDISADDLKNYAGAGNPPCYVSGVTYGRVFILLYESSETVDLLKMAINAAFNNDIVYIGSDNKKVLAESKCTMLRIGGNPKDGIGAALFNDPDKLKAFLVQGAGVSRDSPGVLISCTVKHLIDNSVVRIANVLEYDVTNVEFSDNITRNNVIVDLFSIGIDAPAASGKYNISPRSYLSVDNISVAEINAGVVDPYTVPTNLYAGKKIPVKGGWTVPLYWMQYLPKCSDNTRIRINLTGKLFHSTYHGGRDEKTVDVDLTQEFEYNKKDNAWTLVEPESDPVAGFRYIPGSWNFANMSTTIKLNYRFSCDGRVYPL